MSAQTKQDQFIPLVEQHKGILYKAANAYCKNAGIEVANYDGFKVGFGYAGPLIVGEDLMRLDVAARTIHWNGMTVGL